MPRYDIITFDCYGTLIDWEEGMRAAFRSAGCPDTDAALREYSKEEPLVEATYRSYREVLTIAAERALRAAGCSVQWSDGLQAVASPEEGRAGAGPSKGAATPRLSFRAGGAPEARSAARNPPQFHGRGIAGDPSPSTRLGMTGRSARAAKGQTPDEGRSEARPSISRSEALAGGGFLADSLPSWIPFSDTNAALEALRASGYRLGILSNVDDALLRETRRHFTVDFDLIVTAQQVRSYKPGRPHFDAARERIGSATWLHAAQSNFHDIAAANALGIPTAWINRKGEQAREGGIPTMEFPDLASFARAMAK